MKNKFVFPILAGAILYTLFASCNGYFNASEGRKTGLDSASLFNKEAVLVFVKEHPETNKKAASYFAKGVDEYRNKKNVNAAYDQFIKSVSTHPTAKAYYELGNVCLDNKQYQQAIQAYIIAEQLGYEPVSKLFYNIACAYSLQKKENGAVRYLEFAIEAGYSNSKQIMNDPDLEYLRSFYQFQESYQEAMSGASDPEVTLWQTFKRGFKIIPLPITLDMKTQIDDYEKSTINFEFEKFVSEMRDAKFSRDVGKDFYYYAVVEDNANYTAFVYAIRNTMVSEENAPLSYVLISFDSKGILIDKKAVGGQMQFSDPYLACTIQPNLHFEIKQFKNIYQNDPEKNGYENNTIVRADLMGTEHYKIDEHGKFVPLPPELTMK